MCQESQSLYGANACGLQGHVQGPHAAAAPNVNQHIDTVGLDHLQLVQLPHVDHAHGPFVIRQVEGVDKCAVAVTVHFDGAPPIHPNQDGAERVVHQRGHAARAKINRRHLLLQLRAPAHSPARTMTQHMTCSIPPHTALGQTVWAPPASGSPVSKVYTMHKAHSESHHRHGPILTTRPPLKEMWDVPLTQRRGLVAMLLLKPCLHAGTG